MIGALNQACGALVDALLWPFASWPLLGLAVVSLVVALVLLGVLRVLLNREAVTEHRRQIDAALFELRLFADDPRTVLSVAAGLVRRQSAYLRSMLVPLVVAGMPLAILLMHLDARYAYDGLRPGEPALIVAHVSPRVAGAGHGKPLLTLEAPDGITIESPAVWAPALGEIAWRISAAREGTYQLRLIGGGAAVTKRVRVSSSVAPRASVRPEASFWSELRYPAERALPAGSPVDRIALAYPERRIDVLGFGLPWLAVFAVLSTAFAFALRRRFGVVL